MEALIPITLFVSIAAVLILRPITRRLGMLLEAIAREKDVSRQPVVSDARVLNLLEQMNRRVEMMEERLEFTERLVSNRRTESASIGRSRHADPEAANLVRFEEFNPQTQPRIEWPAHPAVARAYMDQLQRSGGLAAARLTALRTEFDRAVRLGDVNQRRTALTQVAAQLDGEVGASRDGARVRDLAAAVRALASAGP